MEMIELKHKSEKELHDLLASKRNELRELRFKVSEKQLKNVRAIRQARLAVAQILTVLNKKDKQASK